MAKIGNTKDIDIRENAGKVAADNRYDVKGPLGRNVEVGNTTDIEVFGKNTEKGRIGADNTVDIQGGLGAKTSVGNTADVIVGDNSGDISSGNRINIG